MVYSPVTFTSKVFIWSGEQVAWHFISVPKSDSQRIKEQNTSPRRGFGAVAVSVTIGETSFDTSLFPDSTSGCFLLPLKAAVRAREDIAAGEQVRVALTVRV